MATFLIGLYTVALVFIFLYSLVLLHLVFHYRRFQKRSGGPPPVPPLSAHPFVTVQLPVYNEMYVIERLIGAVSDFDYPKEKLEIQVLDDSTDGTVELAARKVEELRKNGIQIHHLRRNNRREFKAGALQEGLQTARGDFIAIFDADFLPGRDFLKKTLPYFNDPRIGAVQTRWGHLNRNYSLLTRLQAFALDAHFSIEQQGRNAGGYFINFNGSSGIWRKAAIIDAGGWKGDTLTEDIDLSYRSQCRGWKFMYLENYESPAELPVSMEAIKSQQFRWCKGPAENVRKNLFPVLRSKLPLPVKIHACFHLLNSSVFVCLLLIAVLSVPILFIRERRPEFEMVFKYSSVFAVSVVSITLFYWFSQRRGKGSWIGKTVSFILIYPLFLSVSLGLSLHNGLAVIEGYLGRKTPFVRTPKFNITNFRDRWDDKKYNCGNISLLTILEGVFALYFLGGIFLDFYLRDFALFPVHLMLLVGYGMIFFFSVKHAALAAPGK